ncbi:hypothetical protein TNCV_556021 [Trichonephila clavipes]|uniref:Uncharacterized protein n=1 Tax=Trichonephila clavipes TaxID=2585209 RepID=A0A8X6V6V3_TRICX|nr:hypothetical protein TNCV_556021 [Trichonephila clavipes]
MFVVSILQPERCAFDTTLLDAYVLICTGAIGDAFVLQDDNARPRYLLPPNKSPEQQADEHNLEEKLPLEDHLGSSPSEFAESQQHITLAI